MTKRTEYRRWSNGQLVEEYVVVDEAPLDMGDIVFDDEDEDTNELCVDWDNRKVFINGEEIDCGKDGEKEVLHVVGFEAGEDDPFCLEED